ncbi:MAG TPA: hypothetical protein VD772_13045, partial [Anseongella sp.]|nr:hypothetical protein [Anseongella sp.]
MDVLSTPFPGQVRPQLRWELSFRPYLNYIEEQISRTGNATYKAYLVSIAALLRANPVLLEPVEDFSLLENFQELTELIKLNHIQPGLKEEEPFFAMGTPFPMQLFSYSENFRSLMLDGEGIFRPCLYCEFVTDDHLRKLYWLILEKCYGVQLDPACVPGTFLQLRDEGSERRRYYRFSVNQHFVQLRHEDVLPPLRQEWIDFATGLIPRTDALLVPIELESFVAEGFMIFTVRD